MNFDKNTIEKLDKIKRINLMNSITGIKPVLLVGSKSLSNGTNLAIFSSIVHISSNPPLFGFMLRTNKKVRRDTFENIKENNIYTFNHIKPSFVENAHKTSIKFEKTLSEFDTCNFTEHYIDGFDVPFVKESIVKLGLRLKEIVEMKCTHSRFLVGEIEFCFVEKKHLNEDYSLNLEQSNSVSVGGLNNYYESKKIITLPYARS